MFLEFAVNYRLSDDKSNVKSLGEAKAVLDEKYLTLFVAFGEPMIFSYSDIIGISDHDYKVDLLLTSKGKAESVGLRIPVRRFLVSIV